MEAALELRCVYIPRSRPDSWTICLRTRPTADLHGDGGGAAVLIADKRPGDGRHLPRRALAASLGKVGRVSGKACERVASRHEHAE